MLDLTPILSRVFRGHCWVKTPDGPRRIAEPLDDGKVQLHLAGKRAYGACPIAPGTSTTRLALLDLDSHKGETPWEEMLSIAESITVQLQVREMNATLWRSSGGSGIHIFLLWDTEQDAFSVRESMRQVLADCLLASGTGGVAKGEVEIFPKQDAVPSDGYGSMFILPGAGKSEPIDTHGWPVSAPIPAIPKPERAPHTGEIHGLENLLAALDAIPNRDADSLDYDLWRNIVFAIHHATDGSDSGLALAHRFSSRSPKYDPAFLDERVWPYVRSDRDDAITARTIFHTARAYGFVEDVSDDFDVIADTPPVSTLRFEFVPVHQFAEGKPPMWIIKDVLPRAELGVIYGESGSGKSFLAIDMLASIARGTDWRGKKAMKGLRCGLIAAEGAGGVRGRFKAYAHHYNIKLEELDIAVLANAPNFMEKTDIVDLGNAMRAYGKLDVLVVDTLAQVTAGANENSGEDMGRVIGHCKTLHKVTGAMIILIHHSGKDASKGARGWSGIKGALDVEIEIIRAEHDRVATVSKMKDEEEGAEFGFKLLQVPFGENEDGEIITSCVIEHGPAVIKEKRAKGRKPGANEILVMRTVDDLLTVGNDEMLAVNDVIDAAVNQIPIAEGRRDRRRDVVLQAITTLRDAGRLKINAGYLGLVAAG